VVGGLVTTLAASRARGTADDRDRDLAPGWILALTVVCLVVAGVLSVAFLRPTALAPHVVSLVAIAVPFVLVAGFLVAGVCGYMAGLIGASNSPISGVGILSIVLCASALALAVTPTPATRPALVAFALFVTAIVFACATISNDNLQDLKTGQLVGASPMRQQIALIVGVAAGAAVIPVVLNLLARAYGFAGAANVGVLAQSPLPAPQATLISALAQGVIGGNLEWRMIGIGAAVGAALIVVDAALGAAGRLRVPPLAGGHRHLPADVGHLRRGRRRRALALVPRSRAHGARPRPRRAAGYPRRVGAHRRREPVGGAQRRAHRLARPRGADRPRARDVRTRPVARGGGVRGRGRLAVRVDGAPRRSGGTRTRSVRAEVAADEVGARPLAHAHVVHAGRDGARFGADHDVEGAQQRLHGHPARTPVAREGGDGEGEPGRRGVEGGAGVQPGLAHGGEIRSARHGGGTPAPERVGRLRVGLERGRLIGGVRHDGDTAGRRRLDGAGGGSTAPAP
jgi:MFS family permease